jgi:hypothetical protein
MKLNTKQDTDQKRERFIRIAERRVNKILIDIESLSKCSNKRNYKYDDDDIKKIFKAIDDKLKVTRLLFLGKEGKKESFSLE